MDRRRSAEDDDEEDERPRKRRIKLKGRGHRASDEDASSEVKNAHEKFESIFSSAPGEPIKSVEGWIVFVTKVHEEAQEDDILDKFGEFGQVKNIHVNLDRRTGFVKGYALIEYAERFEAQAAIREMDNATMFGQPVSVDWAFRKKTVRAA